LSKIVYYDLQKEYKVDGGTRKHVKAMLVGLTFKNTVDLANADEIEERGKDEQTEPNPLSSLTKKSSSIPRGTFFNRYSYKVS